MSAYPWIKLYNTTLDDPRLGALRDSAWRRFQELQLLAGECDAGGRLEAGGTPLSLDELAWRLRLSRRRMLRDLETLEGRGLLQRDENGWRLPGFEQAQGRPSPQLRERWRRLKQRQRSQAAEAAVGGEGQPDSGPITAARTRLDMGEDSPEDSFTVPGIEIEEDRDKERDEELDEGAGEAGGVAQVCPAPAAPPPPAGKGRKPSGGVRRGIEPAALGTPPPEGADAAEIYRMQAGLALAARPRAAVRAAVADRQLWRETVEHWLGHHWNPRNIAGMLDLYQRGGPAACYRCGGGGAASESRPIDEMIRDLAGGGLGLSS